MLKKFLGLLLAALVFIALAGLPVWIHLGRC